MSAPTAAELNRAIRSGNTKSIEALIAAEADPNAIHKDRLRHERPLEAAADAGNKKAVEGLLAAGADPNAPLEEGMRPALDRAVFSDTKKHTEIARLLINAGADVHYTAFSEQGHPSSTILTIAAGNARPEVIELLIAAGADVNVFPALGTPLMEAAGEGRVDNMKVLLEHGADPKLCFSQDLGWHYAGLDALGVARYNQRRKAVAFLEQLISDNRG